VTVEGPDSPLAFLRARSGIILLVGLASGVGLLVWALIAPSGAVGAGWAIGLVFWLSIALGSMGLLAIHAVTGGRLRAVLWPAVAPAAASLPAFGLLMLPLLAAVPLIYPWYMDPSRAGHPDVVSLYLNLPGFAARSALAIIGWSVIALVLLGRRPHPLFGIFGLLFYLVMITIIGVDWVLSVKPRFRSSDYGGLLFVTQLLAALAWTATLRTAPPGRAGAAGDLGAMMLAAALGAAYLGFVQYLVIWYGDLPSKAEWFILRWSPGWVWLEGVSLALSVFLPFGALLARQIRQSPAALMHIGACVLAGILAHYIWFIAPPHGFAALPAAALGVLAVGGLWMGLAYGPIAARLVPVSHAEETAHGG